MPEVVEDPPTHHINPVSSATLSPGHSDWGQSVVKVPRGCKERIRTTHRQLEEFKVAVQEWQETCRKAAEADGTNILLMDIAFAGIWCAFIGLQTDLLLANIPFGSPSD